MEITLFLFSRSGKTTRLRPPLFKGFRFIYLRIYTHEAIP